MSLFDRENQYSPEELLGMVLNYSRGLAQDFAGLFDTERKKSIILQSMWILCGCSFFHLSN